MIKKGLVCLVLLSCLITSCEDIAVTFTRKKQPVASHSKLAQKAENEFWQTLHGGHYQNIETADKLLTAAYLRNPNDPELAAHLGFLHIWKITERHRAEKVSPLIVDEIILARKYFSDAVELNPHDARYQGFLGDSQLVEGKIFNDQRQETRGYFTLKHAIHMWPEFNYFTAGYVMSSLPPKDQYFKEGLAWQWSTLDLCAGTKVNRANPDFRPFMKRETQQGPKRACWNSWIAPYNFEGFFMNMGDMLVKSGDWRTGIKIYANARLAENYATWPYREVLEQKIIAARENVQNFQKEFSGASKTMMFQAGYGCVACHQR